MKKNKELPFPKHFDETKIGEVWRVPYQELAEDAGLWAKKHEIPPSDKDGLKVCLLLIDVQNTFCLPGFELFVGGRSGRGAVEDNSRLCSFIYRNLSSVSKIFAPLDTHHSFQIFHPVFWVDKEGGHPKPAQTIISVDEVKSGVWKVNPEICEDLGKGDYKRLQKYALHYVEKLSQGGKYPLMIWPYHAMLGGIGHCLVSAVEAAVFFHGIARKTGADFELKGENPFTENYSALAPEVSSDEEGKPLGCRNQALIDRLLNYDAIVVGGQAKSHCVAWTVADLLVEIKKKNPKMAEKVFLLEDCTSPVVVPGVIDFTDPADRTFKGFVEAGMFQVKSTTPISEWPGVFKKN